MAGNKAGGIKAAAVNKLKYGSDFYREIGRRGGSWCGPKGFAVNPQLAKVAGVKGGSISRRGPAKNKQGETE
jgi:general stress protein YciG